VNISRDTEKHIKSGSDRHSGDSIRRRARNTRKKLPAVRRLKNALVSGHSVVSKGVTQRSNILALPKLNAHRSRTGQAFEGVF